MKMSSKIFFAILIVILASAVLSVLSSQFGIAPPSIQSQTDKNNYENSYRDYSDAIEDFETALNKSDGKALCKSMFSSEMMDELDNDFFKNYSRYLKTITASMEYITEDDFEWNFHEKNKEPLTDGSISYIENYYQKFFETKIDIVDGYKLVVVSNFADGSREESNLFVIRFEDSDWKVAAYSLEQWGCGLSTLSE